MADHPYYVDPIEYGRSIHTQTHRVSERVREKEEKRWITNQLLWLRSMASRFLLSLFFFVFAPFHMGQSGTIALAISAQYHGA